MRERHWNEHPESEGVRTDGVPYTPCVYNGDTITGTDAPSSRYEASIPSLSDEESQQVMSRIGKGWWWH